MNGSRWLIRIAVLLAIPALLAAVQAGLHRAPAPPQKPVKNISTSPETPPDSDSPEPTIGAEKGTIEWLIAKHEAGKAYFVDARPEAQFIEGRIPGSINLPFSAFSSGEPIELAFIPIDGEVIIYCSGGDCDASHHVSEMMAAYYYENLYIFVPGFPAWEEAGQPIEAGAP